MAIEYNLHSGGLPYNQGSRQARALLFPLASQGPLLWTHGASSLPFFQVDRALHSVASNYKLWCGGLPYTVCEYLDTATIDGAAAPPGTPHANKAGHKIELRVVVYRSGDELRAFPSIGKVAREAFDPHHPDNEKSLINNITTSAKETAQAGYDPRATDGSGRTVVQLLQDGYTRYGDLARLLGSSHADEGHRAMQVAIRRVLECCGEHVPTGAGGTAAGGAAAGLKGPP